MGALSRLLSVEVGAPLEQNARFPKHTSANLFNSWLFLSEYSGNDLSLFGEPLLAGAEAVKAYINIMENVAFRNNCAAFSSRGEPSKEYERPQKL